MGLATGQKRKRNGVDAAATDAAAASKKSKKIKNPPPVVEPEEEEEEDDVEGDDDESAEEESDGADESEDEAEPADEGSGDEGSDIDDNVEDLPTDGGLLLPPTAESQTFDELKLSEKTMKAIGEMGFTKMTSIQRSVRLPAPRSSPRFPANPPPYRLFPRSSLARTCSVRPRPALARPSLS